MSISGIVKITLCMACASVLASCAAPQATWAKNGANASSIASDRTACKKVGLDKIRADRAKRKRSSTPSSHSSIVVQSTLDSKQRIKYQEQCMREKGYTQTNAKK